MQVALPFLKQVCGRKESRLFRSVSFIYVHMYFPCRFHHELRTMYILRAVGAGEGGQLLLPPPPSKFLADMLILFQSRGGQHTT